MKAICRLIIVSSVVFFTIACSNDFLDKELVDQGKYAGGGIFLNPAIEYYEHTIVIPEAGNAAYSIGYLPRWIKFKYLKGSFKDGGLLLKFTIQNVPVSAHPGTYISSLTLTIKDVGVYTIPVYFVNE